MSSEELVTIYTVRRTPYTAAAKNATGYSSVDMEYVATSASLAIAKAVDDCEWNDPRDNFAFRTVGSRVQLMRSAEVTE